MNSIFDLPTEAMREIGQITKVKTANHGYRIGGELYCEECVEEGKEYVE